MKICAIADQHGYLPEIPDCDLLLIGGDICHFGRRVTLQARVWLETAFTKWLISLRERGIEVVGVAGNHDAIFQEDKKFAKSLPWIYLEDSGYNYKGINIWGSPWQPQFGGWAFNAKESQLAERWRLIPENTDILLLHGPPFAHLDYGIFGDEHTGSVSLWNRISIIQPRYVICGHIHSGRRQGPNRDGIDKILNSIIINCSIVNEDYRPSFEPVTFDWISQR
jgi:Icc-related predicted phosphoesterase